MTRNFPGSDLMVPVYWIYENQQILGPFHPDQIRVRAQPDTFVSHGNTWVKFEQHPDFRADVAEPLPPVPIVSRGSTTKADIAAITTIHTAESTPALTVTPSASSHTLLVEKINSAADRYTGWAVRVFCSALGLRADRTPVYGLFSAGLALVNALGARLFLADIGGRGGRYVIEGLLQQEENMFGLGLSTYLFVAVFLVPGLAASLLGTALGLIGVQVDPRWKALARFGLVGNAVVFSFLLLFEALLVLMFLPLILDR